MNGQMETILFQFLPNMLVAFISAFAIYIGYKQNENIRNENKNESIKFAKYERESKSLLELQRTITEFINAITSSNEIYFFDDRYFNKNQILAKQIIIKKLYLEIEKSFTEVSTIELLIDTKEGSGDYHDLNDISVKLFEKYRELYNLTHEYINNEFETIPILLEESNDRNLYDNLLNKKNELLLNNEIDSKEDIEKISKDIFSVLERMELRGESILQNIKEIESEKNKMNELAKELRETLIEYIKIYKKVWFERLNS